MGRTACLPVCGGLMPRRDGGTEPGPLFVPIPDQQDLICGLAQDGLELQHAGATTLAQMPRHDIEGHPQFFSQHAGNIRGRDALAECGPG